MSKNLNNAVDKIVYTQGMVSPMRRAELLKILRPVFNEQSDELARLKKLAKVQEEYIELIADRYADAICTAAIHGYAESKESMLKAMNLRIKINQLNGGK